MRLIDADALKEKLLKERDAIPLTYTERYGFGVEFPSTHGQARRGGIKTALRCMEQTPTVDAVEVVRCKDCEHWNEDALACDTLPWVSSSEHANWYAEDFCSYGERRKDG